MRPPPDLETAACTNAYDSKIHLTRPASTDAYRRAHRQIADRLMIDRHPSGLGRCSWAGRSVWYAYGAEDRPLGKLQIQSAEGRGFKSRPVHH